MATANVKVTVIKKLSMSDVHPGADVGAADSLDPVCDLFNVGDEFIFDGTMPENFCVGAFKDIGRWVTALRFGADFPWMKSPGTIVACCTDGLRPVIFQLERIP